jgi:hypothetical protein
MAENSIVYTAVYDKVQSAIADLDALDQLHRSEVLGKYDAAVIDNEGGKPHIVKRADQPGIRVVPELLGGGKLPRKELEEAAQELTTDEAGLIVIGEPTIDKAFDTAITHASKIAKHTFDESTDELTQALTDSIQH